MVVRFLIKVLIDDAILPLMVERIFTEILSTFPTDKDKTTLRQMFLRASVQIIKRISPGRIIGTRVREKIGLLSQSTVIYGPINSLWMP